MTGNVELIVVNTMNKSISITIVDNAYKHSPVHKTKAAGKKSYR